MPAAFALRYQAVFDQAAFGQATFAAARETHKNTRYIAVNRFLVGIFLCAFLGCISFLGHVLGGYVVSIISLLAGILLACGAAS